MFTILLFYFLEGHKMPHGAPIVINNDECLGFSKITHTNEGNKVFIGYDGANVGVATEFWINTSNNTGEIIFANSYSSAVVEQVLDIHFFLEQLVADTISASGLSDVDCSYFFNPCEHNTDYWKNNQTKWALNSVPMKLGTKLYYSKNQILDLLNKPDNSDASIVLAKALIITKFNVAQGSELSPIVQTINAAMNLIGDHRLPYDIPVSFSSPTGSQMLNLATTLNAYNAGNLNSTPCSGPANSIARSTLEKRSENAMFYSLSVFPNPTSMLSEISFSLPKQEEVVIKIFDLSGRLVRLLANANFSSGEHQVKWDATNVISGLYVVRMQAGNYVESKKVVVTK